MSNCNKGFTTYKIGNIYSLVCITEYLMAFWFKELIIFYKDLNDEEKVIYLPMLLPFPVFLISLCRVGTSCGVIFLVSFLRKILNPLQRKGYNISGSVSMLVTQ